MSWNDEKEKEVIFSKAGQLMDNIGEIILEIEKNTDGKVVFGNIGITFNNKLIEIFQLYSKNNITFYNSKLKFVILFYLEEIVLKAMKDLEDYLNMFDVKIRKFGLKKQAQNIIEASKEKVQDYKDLRSKLFDFDISKDIIEAVKQHIVFNEINGKSGGYDLYEDRGNEVILEYNEELRALGFDIQIPLSVFSERNAQELENKGIKR